MRREIQALYSEIRENPGTNQIYSRALAIEAIKDGRPAYWGKPVAGSNRTGDFVNTANEHGLSKAISKIGLYQSDYLRRLTPLNDAARVELATYMEDV